MALIRDLDGTLLDVVAGAAKIVGVGSSSTPTNALVSVSSSLSTALIAAAASTVTTRTTLLRNMGSVTVYVAFTEAATSAKFPILQGETLRSKSLLAINGLAASSTGSIAVLSEAT